MIHRENPVSRSLIVEQPGSVALGGKFRGHFTSDDSISDAVQRLELLGRETRIYRTNDFVRNRAIESKYCGRPAEGSVRHASDGKRLAHVVLITKSDIATVVSCSVSVTMSSMTIRTESTTTLS